MSAQHVGVGAFELAVEKLFDKIPDKAFAKETYGLGKDDGKPSRRQSQSERGRNVAVAGAGAGVGAAAAEDSDRDDIRELPDTQPRSRGSRRDSARYSQDSQDSYNSLTRRRKSTGGQNLGLYNDGPSDNPRGRSDDAFWSQQERVESPMQQDPYYPPPPGQNYHRYNPADYQPQNYSGSPNGAYATTRYQGEPYARPSSAGTNNNRYSDDRDRDRRYSTRDDRREDRREGRRKKRRSPSRSRSSSSSGGLKSKFDSSKEGLTTGAIGALAGGLIGNEVGKGALATIAGLVIGGLGANAWEARDNKKKSERERSRSRAPAKSSGRARSEGRDKRRSSVYQGSGGNSGDWDNYDRGNDRYAQSGGRARGFEDRDGGGGGGYQSGSESEEERQYRKRKEKERKKKEREKEHPQNDPGPWGEVLKW